MLNWYSIGFSALWILGLGLEVASLSYAYYLANQHQQHLMKILKIPACRFTINLGLVFFFIGWAGSEMGTWERLVWAVLALIFGLRIWRGEK